ncbi:hypothetical protein NS14008_10265 [Nocardia seriolae]|nr:hypothetical protein NS14008_10265 [Nocardia seriolae]PSK32197.1 hypothetical protein C6575_06225 [Nocardia seriolae]RLP32596.1 hypothetical protein D6158_07155 [Nocardia seriolae]
MRGLASIVERLRYVPKRLITVVMLGMSVAAMSGCADHRGTPLTPPSPSSSVPVLGGGQVPDVIDVPTTSPSTTTTRVR